jgi:hypothetical protein
MKTSHETIFEVIKLGSMPIFIKHSESNQYNFKNTFLDGASPHTYCG